MLNIAQHMKVRASHDLIGATISMHSVLSWAAPAFMLFKIVTLSYMPSLSLSRLRRSDSKVGLFSGVQLCRGD